MKTNAHSRRGGVLFTTLLLLLGVVTLVGVTLNVSSSNARLTARSQNVAKAEAAAEGALEYAYGVWLRRIAGTPITTEEANRDLVLPEFEGISYAKDGVKLRIDALDEYGVPMTSGTIPPRVTGRVPGYEGWSGQTFTYVAQARIQVDEKTVVGVKRLFQYTEVPLFQSMFFFQGDLEFYNPATMVLNGLVHSNGNIYFAFSSSNPVTVGHNVTYAKEYALKEAPSAKYWNEYSKIDIKDAKWATGQTSQLHKVPSIQPMGSAPEKVFNPDESNLNDDGYRELIEPAVPGHDDPEAIATRRLINKAGLVIEISGTGGVVSITPQNGTTANATAITALKEAFSKINSGQIYVSTTNKKGTVTTTATNVGFYDRRESKYVDVVDVNMGTLKSALSSGVSNFNNVIYIHDTTSTETADDPEPKAIRLKNGKILPDAGLTIASQNPVYIQGDYNTKAANGATDDRKPAAVIADAVMLLSNNWSDSNSAAALSSRIASSTTYNTAILAGFMPSTDSTYSGGANNFPRFLEDWSGKNCTYNGSMVELFPSKVFVGEWKTSPNFKPPTRLWNFDNNFLNRPPPGSVDAIVLSRGPWSRF